MTFGLTKDENLRKFTTYVILANPKTDFFVYQWPCAQAMFVRASDVISSTLLIHWWLNISQINAIQPICAQFPHKRLDNYMRWRFAVKLRTISNVDQHFFLQRMELIWSSYLPIRTTLLLLLMKYLNWFKTDSMNLLQERFWLFPKSNLSMCLCNVYAKIYFSSVFF